MADVVAALAWHHLAFVFALVFLFVFLTKYIILSSR
jgi:hypothetical protein